MDAVRNAAALAVGFLEQAMGSGLSAHLLSGGSRGYSHRLRCIHSDSIFNGDVVADLRYCGGGSPLVPKMVQGTLVPFKKRFDPTGHLYSMVGSCGRIDGCSGGCGSLYRGGIAAPPPSSQHSMANDM